MPTGGFAPQTPPLQLSGELPALPGNLVALDVTANNLGGTLQPLDASPRLEALMVGSNAFEGSLPPLPATLVQLDASYNRLKGVHTTAC